jgi:PBP1b-binding outer membrane lipoprotein LpoB
LYSFPYDNQSEVLSFSEDEKIKYKTTINEKNKTGTKEFLLAIKLRQISDKYKLAYISLCFPKKGN